MSDLPTPIKPYANMLTPPSYDATHTDPTNKDGKGITPKGRNIGKVSQAQQAIKGLIGAK